MRGRSDGQLELFHVFVIEDRIRADHPLRSIKLRVDELLASMSSHFDAAYSGMGRPSVPPERLLKALLLMALYSIRSERQLCERIDTDLLFRWFLEMSPSEEVFDPTSFSHNRKRIEDHQLTTRFFDAIVAYAVTQNLCSEHFSVDGSLIESYASAKSFQPRTSSSDQPDHEEDKPGGNGDGTSPGAADKTSKKLKKHNTNGFKPRNLEVDFHGHKRSNATHQSTTDPEARLYRKGPGKEAKLAHLAHLLSENRHGLIMALELSEANGTAESLAALSMLDRLLLMHQLTPQTLGADKGYDSAAFLEQIEQRTITPHIALARKMTQQPESKRKAKRRAKQAIRLRMQTRQHSEGYRLSQKCRKKVEECFGWLKEIACLARSRVIDRWKIKQLFELGAAAFNLIRLKRLLPIT